MPMRQNKIVNPASTLQAMVTFGSTVSSNAIVEETDKRNVPHAQGFLIKQWKWNYYQCSLVIFLPQTENPENMIKGEYHYFFRIREKIFFQ